MSCRNRWVSGLILAMHVIASPAAGEVVIHTNTNGPFPWLPIFYGTYFDPTQPPTQSGARTDFGLAYQDVLIVTSESIGVGFIRGEQAIEIAVNESYVVEAESGDETITPAKVFVPGESVGPNSDWSSRADHAWDHYLQGYHDLLGEEPTIGFRTEADGQYRYGWIKLGVRRGDFPFPGDFQGNDRQPLLWAYETELNTPITVIPEPATWALLTVCCVIFSLGVCRNGLPMFPRRTTAPNSRHDGIASMCAAPGELWRQRARESRA